MLSKHEYGRLEKLKTSFFQQFLKIVKDENSFERDIQVLIGYFDDTDITENTITFRLMDYRFVMDAVISSNPLHNITYRTYEVITQMDRVKSLLEPDYKPILELNVYYDGKGYFRMDNEPFNQMGRYDPVLFEEWCRRITAYVDSIEIEGGKRRLITR